MSGFPWGAFAVGLGWAAAAAFAVMLATFAVAVRKGVHRVVDAARGLGLAARRARWRALWRGGAGGGAAAPAGG
ncbi:hypothetical protein ACFWIR_37035, partial [Streptomyces olivaceus]